MYALSSCFPPFSLSIDFSSFTNDFFKYKFSLYDRCRVDARTHSFDTTLFSSGLRAVGTSVNSQPHRLLRALCFQYAYIWCVHVCPLSLSTLSSPALLSGDCYPHRSHPRHLCPLSFYSFSLPLSQHQVWLHCDEWS